LPGSAFSSRRRSSPEPQVLVKARTSSKTLRLTRRESLGGQVSRDDTGCPRLSKEGTLTAGIAEKSLRFGTATHVACRAVPGTLRHSQGSFMHEPRASGVSSSSGASRERRSRDRPPREPQKAWLLTSALITLGTEASARIGEIPNGSALSNADKRSQTSRGGGWRARTGVARASFRNGRNRVVRASAPRMCLAQAAALVDADESGSRARASLLGNTSRARFERRVSTSPRWRKKSSSIEEAYLRDRRVSRQCSARRQALDSTPMEGVSDDRSHASAFTAAREEVVFGGSGS